MPRLFRRCGFPVLVGALSIACSVDGDDGALTFGGSATTAAATSFTTTMTATTVDPSSSTTDDVSSSGGEEETSGSDNGEEDSSDSASSADSTGGPNEQPEDGMYSDCTDLTDCFGQNLCVVVMVGDGFCTTTPCAIPGDCDPSPGGSAAPACVEVMPGSTACALDCSGGKTCPGGMVCGTLGASMVCT